MCSTSPRKNFNNSLIAHLIFLYAFLIVALAHSGDYYLNELRDSCYASGQAFSCAKYRVFDYVDNFQVPNVNLTSDSSVKIIEIPRVLDSVARGGNATSSMTMMRSGSGESEWMKMAKFFGRKVHKFFASQGLALELPEGVRILEDGRDIDSAVEGRGKKKKTLLLSFLILIKVIKIKFMLHGIMGGIFLIQKTLLIGAILLPKAFAAVKEHCKKQHAYHVTPYYLEADDHHKHHFDHHYTHEEPEVTATGYGYSGYEHEEEEYSKKPYFFNKLKHKLHLS